MNTAGSFITRFNNSKKNLFNSGRRDKINNLKITIIMNNTVKTKNNNNLNFLNNERDLKYRNKCKGRFYNKKIIIKIKKYGSLNQINITEKKFLILIFLIINVILEPRHIYY